MSDFRTDVEFRQLMFHVRQMQQNYEKIREKLMSGKSAEEMSKSIIKHLNSLNKQAASVPYLCERVHKSISGDTTSELEGQPEEKKNHFLKLAVFEEEEEETKKPAEKAAKKKAEEPAPTSTAQLPANSMYWICQRYEAGENLRTYFTKAQEDEAKASAKKEHADFDSQEKAVQRKLVARKLWEMVKNDKALKAKIKAEYDALKAAN